MPLAIGFELPLWPFVLVGVSFVCSLTAGWVWVTSSADEAARRRAALPLLVVAGLWRRCRDGVPLDQPDVDTDRVHSGCQAVNAAADRGRAPSRQSPRRNLRTPHIEQAAQFTDRWVLREGVVLFA